MWESAFLHVLGYLTSYFKQTLPCLAGFPTFVSNCLSYFFSLFLSMATDDFLSLSSSKPYRGLAKWCNLIF